MEIHKNLEKYFSDDLKRINKILFEIDRLQYEHDNGDFHPLCDISGICEADESEEGKPDGYVTNCYYCGTELEVFKGNFYHYSAFHLPDFFENYISYNTHNHRGTNSGPTTVEEREIEELKSELNKLKHKINSNSIPKSCCINLKQKAIDTEKGFQTFEEAMKYINSNSKTTSKEEYEALMSALSD